MKYLSALAVLLFPIVLLGEISFTITEFPSGGNCNGKILVTANGNAGPFQLKIEMEGQSLQTEFGVTDNYEFINLCAGVYTIEVSSEVYPICAKNLEVHLNDDVIALQGQANTQVLNNIPKDLINNSPKDNGNLLNKSSGVQSSLEMKVYPNPFSNKVNVAFNNEHIVSNIKVLNALGQQVKEFSTFGEKLISFDLGETSSSLFIIQAINKEGSIIAVEQLTKIE